MPPRPSPARRPAVSVSLALIALGAAALPRVAAAQPPRPDDAPRAPWEREPRVTVAFTAGGLYSSVDRSAAAHDGFGFDAATYLGVSDFALGVGYQRTVHERGGPAGSAVYEGLFVEPRVAVPLGYGAFTPYLAGRLVRIHPLRGSRDQPRGAQLGGGAGVLVAVAPRVRLDLGASYGRLRFDAGSALVAGDPTTGVAQLRAGLLIGLGRRTEGR